MTSSPDPILAPSSPPQAQRHASARPSAPRDEANFAGLAHFIRPARELADRDALIGEIDALVAAEGKAAAARGAVLDLLAEALESGRSRVQASLLEEPCAGLRVARAYAHVTDVVVASLAHYATAHLHPAPIRT
ncbi:MAG: hypothetical protein AAFU72_03315, partial [Pseudomonadota bacterium]